MTGLKQLRHALGLVLARFLKLLSWCYRFEYGDTWAVLKSTSSNSKVIITVWHEDLICAYLWALQALPEKFPAYIIISAHRDADLAIPALKDIGFSVFRGSSRKGGVSALLSFLKNAQDSLPLILVPDGPLGPPKKLKPQIKKLAKKLGAVIMHFSFTSRTVLRLPTWDRLKIPLPGSKIIVHREFVT